MKKILIFSTAYLPMIGGAEVAVKEITDRVLDYDFDLITARINKTYSKEEKIGRVNIYRVGFGNKFDKLLLPILGTIKAIKLNKRNNYGLIWSIMASQGGMTALLFKLLKKDVKFLLTLQEGDSEKHILKRVGIFYPLWKQIFKRADYIQVISNYLKDFALKHGFRNEVKVIPNGVDMEEYRRKLDQSSNEYKEKIKKDFGFEKNDKVIITVSRLVKKNGVNTLIRAMNNIDAKLLIIGGGEEGSNLEKLIKEEGLEKKVKFGGVALPPEVPYDLMMSDIFCRPSRSEGFGNVFIEAMAAGLPVVATNVGGIKDFLIDGENGLVCKVDDPKDVAEKINRILNNKELGNEFIKRGFETANKYDWKDISNSMKNIFDLNYGK